MSNLEIGIASFPALLLLIFLRVPIGLAMFIIGYVGYWIVTGDTRMPMARLKSAAYSTFASESLAVVPMFLLMGYFATLGGMSKALFKAAESFVGHRKGGVGIAAIASCAGFGAICGSSLATAATMGRVALPEMKRFGYHGGISTAALAAGGTLGILIPPSVVLVIYAILAEQNIAKLFLAAVAPGVLAAIGYMIALSIYVHLYPERAGVGDRVPWSERLRLVVNIWPVMLVFLAVVGGIYGGIFTPTEGSAVGALGTGLIALFNGGLNFRSMLESFTSTGRATAMIFFIVFGAAFYNSFLALTQVPQTLSDWVANLGWSPIAVLVLILVIYMLLGCVMDSLSMILLTVPIFFPMMMALDFGMSAEHVAIWFGILVLIVVETGLITPPVGMNLFIINAMDRETPMIETYKAVIFFVLSDIVRVAILVAFPVITLFLI
ncbi:TRAP transporter large permease [Pararhodobacter oceanensis]|uniref:TRAP transporter large permease protein n=1 Tax=Pararhodobacter oceanensis TaxID=2172121 RepID=A0A2T8HR68_9RHOB|nr:TRAP transporter large permease [Pararhodobacter oceanensis]PVH27822.1 C4-dicarboxylate ABC transporter permease [Pararhodobacter oceanensis]